MAAAVVGPRMLLMLPLDAAEGVNFTCPHNSSTGAERAQQVYLV